jgi:hypothetical protein
MVWLFPLLSTLAGALALFLSKPERKGLAWIASLLILVPGIWQAATQRADHLHKRELERQAVRLLYLQTISSWTLLPR